jgi:hypothetical protein
MKSGQKRIKYAIYLRRTGIPVYSAVITGFSGRSRKALTAWRIGNP